MTKLVDLTGPQPKALIKKFQDRVVCDITEYNMVHPMFGRYKAWIGSVEEEYFSIVFMAGFLTISLEEREGCLGWDIQKYACTQKVREALDVKEDADMRKMILEYTEAGLMMADLENVTAQDVLKVLKWKLKKGKEIQYDIMNP